MKRPQSDTYFFPNTDTGALAATGRHPAAYREVRRRSSGEFDLALNGYLDRAQQLYRDEVPAALTARHAWRLSHKPGR